jgi:hypothetical protein
MSQYLLVHATKESFEYDPARALEAWRALHPLIPEDDNRGYGEQDWISDDDRIIQLFELLDGSQLGDMLFGSLADADGGVELATRTEDAE